VGEKGQDALGRIQDGRFIRMQRIERIEADYFFVNCNRTRGQRPANKAAS
jgi:hypothetical protein